MYKSNFIQALKSNSVSQLQAIPKSDLHNHAGRGGHISCIETMLGVSISPLTQPLASLSDMDEWFKTNIKSHFPDKNGYIQRIATAFKQAKADSIAILALSYGVDEVRYLGGIDIFAAVMDGLHRAFAPETRLAPDLTISDAANIHSLDELFSANWFKGVDFINYSGSMSMDAMKAMSRKAHAHKLTVKAHVGEFGGADDVLRYAEELELTQIQHGIAAAQSPQIMNWLARHKIQLNVCPTSNIMLRNANSYASHQIRQLFDHGIPITLNTDDLLIFGASASDEYLNLYNAGLMSAEELNVIRETGLGGIIT